MCIVVAFVGVVIVVDVAHVVVVKVVGGGGVVSTTVVAVDAEMGWCVGAYVVVVAAVDFLFR